MGLRHLLSLQLDSVKYTPDLSVTISLRCTIGEEGGFSGSPDLILSQDAVAKFHQLMGIFLFDSSSTQLVYTGIECRHYLPIPPERPKFFCCPCGTAHTSEENIHTGITAPERVTELSRLTAVVEVHTGRLGRRVSRKRRRRRLACESYGHRRG